MGIKNLLQILKPIVQPVHLSHFAGKTIAIDAYVILHRATYGCATELCLGKPTSKHRYLNRMTRV
jgi:exonuclease-1